MASNLPVNIPIPSSESILSYNWSDLQAGIAYISLWGFSTCDGDLNLSPNQLPTHGNLNGEKSGISSPNYWDYDSLTFTKPSIIDGSVAIIRFRWYFKRVGQAGTGSGSLKAKLVLKSGASETTISTEATTQTLQADNGTTTYGNSVLKVDTTRTKVKIGDIITLRITINFAYDYHFSSVYNDPEDVNNYLRVEVPFKAII